jgi:hypothetical protein
VARFLLSVLRHIIAHREFICMICPVVIKYQPVDLNLSASISFSTFESDERIASDGLFFSILS